MDQRMFLMDDTRIPHEWYNVLGDLNELPPPPLDPATGQPCGPEKLAAIFPMGVIEQEVSTQTWIPIPDAVRERYAMWRPTPLIRATFLEKALDTPAHIYYKYEGASPVGSHKLNTAIAQAYYNKVEGTHRIATETGAGQWGAALSMACASFGIDCTVYMVRCSYGQKPYRRSMMMLHGAEVYPSPSEHTEYGRKILAEDPDCPGSLGIAISEAIEDTVTHPGVKYSLGSVLNHVVLHQTVIGLESLEQMRLAGEFPDVVIGCAGGGSNLGGMITPFVAERLRGNKVRLVAAEPSACPSLTKGEYRYDFGDTAHMTPQLMMYTLGSEFIPPAIHAGGLRYHGMSPLLSWLKHTGHMEAVAVDQLDVFAAAVQFTRAEGIVPAPESSHAIAAVIKEAIQAREAGEERVILFNLSGHGLLDMASYDAYLSHSLESTQ